MRTESDITVSTAGDRGWHPKDPGYPVRHR